jgi:hypothetical protein
MPTALRLRRLRALALGVLAGLLGAAPAARSAPPAFTAALSFRLLADDNLYLLDRAPLAPGQTAPALPSRASDVAAATALALRLACTPSPAFALDLTYAPEVIRYARHAAEDSTHHRLALNLGGNRGPWRYELRQTHVETAGSVTAPVFNCLGGGPPIGGEPVRARRAQSATKGTWKLTRACAATGFVRGVATLNQNDFHTRETAVTGYANYVDRAETAVGTEAGLWVSPRLALVTGVRQGRQSQANLLGTSLNYTNAFTRWLVGAETKPSPVWQCSLLAGPDVRRFGAAVRPGFNRHRTAGYAEAAAAWQPRPADTFTLTGKHYLWLSGAGRGAYTDTLVDLVWRHTLARGWSVAPGLNVHEGVTGPLNPAAPRRDQIGTATLALARQLAAATRAELVVQRDASRTLVANTPARAYHRWTLSAGLTRTW